MAKIAQGKKILLRFDKGLQRFLQKKWEISCAFVDIAPMIERRFGGSTAANNPLNSAPPVGYRSRRPS